MRKVILVFVSLLVGAASPAFAQEHWSSRVAMHGEMGLAAASSRLGFAVGFGPSVHLGRATLTGWVDGLFTGGLDLGSVYVRDREVRCAKGLARGDSTPCQGRSDMLMGTMLEATTLPEKDVPMRVGLGYRLGTGHGPTAVLIYDNTALKRTSITFSARVGVRYFAVRVGARLTP